LATGGSGHKWMLKMRVVILRVMNASYQVHGLAAETVIALAKPVTSVVSVEFSGESDDSIPR